MRGRQLERLQQGGEVVAVLVDAALRVGPLAARVAAAVIAQDAEVLRQAGNHESPGRRVAPRAMNQGQRLAAAVELVVEPYAVYFASGMTSPRSPGLLC